MGAVRRHLDAAACGDGEGKGGRSGGELGAGNAGGDGVGGGGEGIKREKVEETGMKESNYVAAAKFGGKRDGYTFKSGRQGLGYYRDWKADRVSVARVHALSPDTQALNDDPTSADKADHISNKCCSCLFRMA